MLDILRGQTLTTLQPTSSTVRFTVSTRPVPKTLPALLAYYVSLLLKAVIGALALAILLLKWELRSAHDGTMARAIGGDDTWLARLVHTLQWRYLLPSGILILYLVLRRGYTGTVSLPILCLSFTPLANIYSEESLLVLRSLGLQVSTTSSTYLSTAAKRFIPTTSIQDIFIHEAFIGFEVRFYLAVVVKGEEDVVVVFPQLLPKRDMLEVVWRGARACLYEDGGVKGKAKAEKEKMLGVDLP